MMFRGIFLFEIDYRKNRAVTYIYFAIIFLISFLSVASPIKRAIGQISPNAPYVISLWTLAISFAFTMITSAVMGVAIVRDFDNNMEEILFSTPIRKADYLMGRFWGSFVVLVFINSGIWLGLLTGFFVGQIVPWEVAWRGKELLSFNLWHFLQPFLIFGVSNLFITGSLFFMSGALARNTIIIYTQGVLLLILYQVGSTLLTDSDSQPLAALIDPFGVHTYQYVTRYWTPAQQNQMLVPLEGVMLYNRLLWITVGVIALIITHYGFSFNSVRRSFIRWNLKRKVTEGAIVANMALPLSKQIINSSTYFTQFLRLSLFYFRIIWKEIPFLVIVVSGVLLLFVNAAKMNAAYGTSSYPTTYNILNLINSFSLFFLVITIFYSGELIWKERAIKINLIMDTMPIPTFIGLVSKFGGLVLVYISLLCILVFFGVMVQTAYAYLEFDLAAYFGTLFTSTLSYLILYTLLAIFIQSVVNNKFLGFVLCILFFIVQSVLTDMGLEHGLWRFASGTLGTFSDMNRYGHFVEPFSWFRIYWTAFSVMLFCVAVLFSTRGFDSAMKMRWKSGRSRLTKPFITFFLSTAGVFLLSGIYIYYNTNVINNFDQTKDLQMRQAEYEKVLGRYEFLNQPKIVETNLQVDLFPSQRMFNASGFYYLKNKSDSLIKSIHVQQYINEQLSDAKFEFDRKTSLAKAYERLGYFIYDLEEPLAPGDSLKMHFTQTYKARGFQEEKSNMDIVYNGTFFNTSYFPSLGYNKNFELLGDEVRRQNGLTSKAEMPDIMDSRGRQTNLFGDDADRIRFEIMLSTENDQIAVAPGHLQKAWKDGDRNYFHYKMDVPMANFYSIASARYAVKKDKWRNVDLEIYYHPGHEFNLDRMMESMKSSLDYNADNFSPYQFKQLRIVEFPRYKTFAQTFANTIPFSESMGFVLKVEDPDKDLDMAYYVTAHEAAHQWWGQQVMEANVKGSGLLSESLSQYTALMVMKHHLPMEKMERYLKYELDGYLTGRATEGKKEQPLQFVEKQTYIQHSKASLIFFALQDYIGEKTLNDALRKYVQAWAFKETPYPTSQDFLQFIKQETPDSLKYLIHDMFETITLFENKTKQAIYEEKPGGGFEVTISISCAKLRADSLGMERDIPINDWIDVGIYAKEDNGKDKLVYLTKHKFTEKENTLTISVPEKPEKAGIDPLHKLVDRHSDDNTVQVKRLIDITGALGQ